MNDATNINKQMMSVQPRSTSGPDINLLSTSLGSFCFGPPAFFSLTSYTFIQKVKVNYIISWIDIVTSIKTFKSVLAFGAAIYLANIFY